MKTQLKIICLLVSILYYGCSDDDGNTLPTSPNNLEALQGDWYRVGWNNPDFKGMKVNVNEDQGTLLEPALSNFQVDDIKWQNIMQTDTYQYRYKDLTSSYNYFDATMTFGVDDTLRIDVANSGIENIQKWVRTFIEPAVEVNDCSEYSAEGFTNSQLENWSDYNDFDTYPSLLQTPGEPGGGYFTYSITNEEIAPGLNVTASGGSSGAIYAESSAGTSNPNANQVAFLAHPGISYNVRVNIGQGSVSSYPLEYSMNWTYVPAEDCFEPNNSRQEAKSVPKGESLEAYGIAGYISNYVSSGDENTYDYYKIVTQTEGKIRFALDSCPADLWISCALRNFSGAQINGQYTTIIGDANTHQPGTTYYYESNSIHPAGTYYVQLQMNGATVVDLNTDSIPEYWNTPYMFTVTNIE
ncbi:hypothetical protein [Psychroserpens algicola]|uniref:hypothetical protein n=1 Tax=Psychroserpens algicola TaxID=1719034 RepID=UPI0019531286|nr:hypothetical protein [Psychroserpens algicola]